MILECEETRVLRIYDLWYVFQHPGVVYPKRIYIFELIDNALEMVNDYDFEEWYCEWENRSQDYEIIELNFGTNEESFISCVRGKFNG